MESIIPLNFERTLNFESNGKQFIGTLRFDRLERMADQKWACYWSCDYLCEDGHVFGDDPTHALLQCFRLFEGLMRGANSTGLSIWWRSPGDHCRFPIFQ